MDHVPRDMDIDLGDEFCTRFESTIILPVGRGYFCFYNQPILADNHGPQNLINSSHATLIQRSYGYQLIGSLWIIVDGFR